MNVEAIAAFGKSSGIHAFMNTTYGWPTIEAVHFIALATLLGTVGLFDLRVLGVGRGAPISALHRLIPIGVAAFAVNIVTGVMFFVSAPDQYAYNPAFQMKASAMMIAGLNVLLFYAVVSRRAGAYRPDGEAGTAVKVVAGVSLAAWICVVALGRLITYFRPPYHWCFWC